MNILNSNNFLYKTVDGVKQFFSPLVNASTVVLEDGSRLEKGGKVYADHAVSADKLGGKDPIYYIQPRNLLDNSWWGGAIVDGVKQELVAQAGFMGYHGEHQYMADRWRTQGEISVTQTNNGITITSASFSDRLRETINANSLLGKTLTLAVYMADGTVVCASSTVPQTSSYDSFLWETHNNLLLILTLPQLETLNVELATTNDASITIKAVALYEGEYTAETLPPYVPKGYGVELWECMRYFEAIKKYTIFTKTNYAKDCCYCPVDFCTPKYKKPHNVEIKDCWSPGYYGSSDLGTVALYETFNNGLTLTVTNANAAGLSALVNVWVSCDL